MKTSELTGRALEWAIATSEGWVNLRWHNYGSLIENDADLVMDRKEGGQRWGLVDMHLLGWNQAGPIIEREQIAVCPYYIEGKIAGWTSCTSQTLAYDERGGFIPGSDHAMVGPSLVVAAMRTFVHLKLGENVELPKELL